MASQPVAVHIPVGPPRAEELIYLPANEPLVLAYPCLPWVQHVAAGGAQQQASLPQFVAIRVFLLRNAIGTGPNDLAIARTRTPLTISFSAGAWSRWLTELVASGLLANAPYPPGRLQPPPGSAARLVRVIRAAPPGVGTPTLG